MEKLSKPCGKQSQQNAEFERLRILNLTSLKDRRTREDLIDMFKLQKGLEKIELVKPPLLTKNDGLLGTPSSTGSRT